MHRTPVFNIMCTLAVQAEAAVEPEAPVRPSEEDLWYRKMAEPMYFQVGAPSHIGSWGGNAMRHPFGSCFHVSPSVRGLKPILHELPSKKRPWRHRNYLEKACRRLIRSWKPDVPALTHSPAFKQDPWQLRQIFGDLEEGNLFLIQTSQVILYTWLPEDMHY